MDFHCQDRSLGNSEQKYAPEVVVKIMRRQPIIVVQEGSFLFFLQLQVNFNRYVRYLITWDI